MSVVPYIYAIWHSSGLGKAIIIILLIFLVGYSLIAALGWWALLPIGGFILSIVLGFCVSEWKEENKRKKEQKREQQRLANKITEQEKLKESHPTAVQFEYTDKYGHPSMGFCWLVFGKTGRRPEVFENQFFRIQCALSPDFEAIFVSIKNYSKGPINIDYKTFTLNNERISVDKTNDYLEPQEEATWSLRPYRHGGLSVYLGKQEIVKNEMRCDIRFSIMFEDKTIKSFVFNMYTQTKVV